MGEKNAGELLAAFELLEANPTTDESDVGPEPIRVTSDNYPANSFVTKFMKNAIHQIPPSILPAMKTYEIEVSIDIPRVEIAFTMRS